MFRTKITLTFVFLTCILAGTGYVILHTQITDTIEKDSENSLRRAATIQEQEIRLDEEALLSKARFSANNPRLYKYMQPDDNPELYEQLAGEYTQASNATEVRHLAVYDRPLSTDEIRLKDIAKRVEGKRELGLDSIERRPVIPDMFMILDQDGVGVAALGKDRYSWFGDNVAKDYPIVLDAIEANEAKTAVWQWQWGPTSDRQLYRVAVVPIRPQKDMSPAGVVVAGNVIDDGKAREGQRVMAGITLPPEETKEVTEEDVPRMPQVAFFQGSELHGTTFSTEEEQKLAPKLFDKDKKNILASDKPEEMLTVQLDGKPYRVMIRFLSGEFQQSDKPAGFAVFTNMNDATASVDTAKKTLLMVSGGVLLVGIIAFMFFVYQFMKPIARLEEGITEILAGNKDYEFEVDDDSVFASLAQGLNLMSAYLQGKPMPDDAEDLGGWGELIGDTGESSSSGKSEVHGVPGMGPSSGGKTPGKSDEDDSADEGDGEA